MLNTKSYIRERILYYIENGKNGDLIRIGDMLYCFKDKKLYNIKSNEDEQDKVISLDNLDQFIENYWVALQMHRFKIDKNDNGYHIYGEPYHWQEYKFIPLHTTCKSYEDCIKWLDENYPNNYELIT